MDIDYARKVVEEAPSLLNDIANALREAAALLGHAPEAELSEAATTIEDMALLVMEVAVTFGDDA